MKNGGGELAQKIYRNCQPDQAGFTEAVFTELKKLVKLLEEAHGTKTANTKTELEQFISDSENDANQKKALEIVKKVKNQDGDSKDCVEMAREKLKDPEEDKLKQARQKLKSLLAGLKIGSQDAYEEMVVDIKDSEFDLNKTCEIWQKCQEVDTTTNDDTGELLEALNNLKDDARNKKAWDAVNKYKRNGQGYATDRLKKLTDWAEQRKKGYPDLRNVQSQAEFQKVKEEFMKSPEYQNEQQDYDQIFFPLLEKVAQIRENGTGISPKEKELVDLLTIRLSDYSDWKTQLEDLEDKTNKLKEFLLGGQKYKVVENYSTTQKEALAKLVSKMVAKVQEWKNQKVESKKSETTQEKPSWYKTPLGIIGIIMVLVIIAGAIYYLVKQQTKASEGK